jgi:hypothetical protein
LRQLVVPFANNGYYLIAFVEVELEQCDHIIRHELSRNRSVSAVPVFVLLAAVNSVLDRLDYPEPVRSALGLDRYDVLLSLGIDTHVELVDFDLAVVGDLRPEVILERISDDSQEGID